MTSLRGFLVRAFYGSFYRQIRCLSRARRSFIISEGRARRWRNLCREYKRTNSSPNKLAFAEKPMRNGYAETKHKFGRAGLHTCVRVILQRTTLLSLLSLGLLFMRPILLIFHCVPRRQPDSGKTYAFHALRQWKVLERDERLYG